MLSAKYGKWGRPAQGFHLPIMVQHSNFLRAALCLRRPPSLPLAAQRRQPSQHQPAHIIPPEVGVADISAPRRRGSATRPATGRVQVGTALVRASPGGDDAAGAAVGARSPPFGWLMTTTADILLVQRAHASGGRAAAVAEIRRRAMRG